MGMYTELIFGAELKKDTPDIVIKSLQYMLGELPDKPEGYPLPDGRFVFLGGSYYFAINSPVNRMWKDNIDNQWRISTRSNIKNYENEIEIFLNWIVEYIDSGSGNNDMYAIVMYEDTETPTIYYLRDND